MRAVTGAFVEDDHPVGLLLGMDLCRMYPEVARQLRHRPFLPNGRQRDLRLELSAMFLACIRHKSPLAYRPF